MKKKLLSLLSVLAVGLAASAVMPSVIEFVKNSTDYAKISAYNGTFESTDGLWQFGAFNNNNNGWDFVAAGWKTADTTPYFATLKASEAPIDNIVVTIGDRYTKSAITAATLYVADNADFTNATETDILSALPEAKNSDMTINVGGTAAGQYVKVQFTIPQQSANGQALSIAKIVINYGKTQLMENELTITPVWVNNVLDGVSNPIPGLDAGWNKPTPTHQSTATATRFATGKDGKIFVNNHIENAIYTWDGKEMAKYVDLPAVTDAKWNGTALSTDDAGNIILNFNFTDAVNSLRNWAVVGKDKKLTEVTLSTTEEELGTHGRLDIISHIVGDVTSKEGGIGYSTTKGSDKIVMFHFTGNGTTVTAVTAKVSSSVPGLAAIYGANVQTETYQAAPKYLTVAELLTGTPENNFYLPIGKLGATNATVTGFEDGVLSNFDGTTYAPLNKMGNRGFGSVATFEVGGQKYIVRNYINPSSANASLLTNWRNVMTFGVFDLDGNCVATWDASTFSNSYGSETYSVEKVDENTVNLYIYAATGNDDLDTPRNTLKGAYGGMFTITSKLVPAKPKGTKELPYIISTPQDLVNMNSMLKAGEYTYFKLANDIDMTGVNYPMPAQNVVANVHLDGQNHVIKNLTINGPFAGLFSLMNGSVKNLGFVDINLTCENWGGAGAIAGYIAQSEPTTIENCFVTGKIQGSNAQLGSFACGARIGGATINNCYSTATLTSTGSMQGGLIGAVMYAEGQENVLNINNSYFAGTINGPIAGGLVGANQYYGHPTTGTEVINVKNCAVLNATLNGASFVNAIANSTNTATINAENVVIAKTTLNGAAADGVAIYEAIPAVMAWNGFNPTEVNETSYLPILAWQSGKEYKADGSEYAPYFIAKAEDLCNAHNLIEKGKTTYFVQTADIDMADEKDYITINGTYGDYTSAIVYDGCNHVISNFAPAYATDGGDRGYYCTSLFGVMTGVVKNLGVVNATVDTSSNASQGAGILAAYVGHDKASGLFATSSFENVFVTGTLKAGSKYTGVFGGTTATAANFTNCFVNVNVETAGGPSGAFVGRTNHPVTFNNCYAAGTVSEACSLVSGSGNGTVTANGLVVFNTGSTSVCATTADVAATMANTAATEDAGFDAVAKWAAFSAEKLVYELPGLAAFDYTVKSTPNGTKKRPYVIATAEDLCNAHSLIEKGKTTYFVQTADIDMADVKDYITINGTYGDYTSAIVYDGGNHVISNFAPAYAADGGDRGYYCTSLFGIMTGVVKNLGVVNATIDTSSNANQGAGILAAYVGHGDASGLFATSSFENVFVTGTLKAGSKYTGVFGGTTATAANFTNCFVNVNVETAGGPSGAFVGRTNHPVTFNNCYAAGTVSETCSLVSGSGNGSVTANGLVVFNTGSTSVCATTADVAATMANTAATAQAGFDAVAAWEAFSAEKLVYELPGLAAFDYTVKSPANGTKERPYEIATVEDLCNAYLKVKANPAGATFFVQTADIDMEGVKDWHPICGFNGEATYTAVVGYDGQNHLIKNFSPEVTAPDAAKDNYYMSTIFGVISGYVKNLGIVDAKVVNNVNGAQGGGFIAAYAGHSKSAALMAATFEDYSTYITNVFATGSYDASENANYIGGLVGTTGANLTIEDCFVNADIKGQKNTAGLVGRLRNELELTRTYVAGTISATGANVALAVASDNTPDVIVDGAYAFNTGAAAAVVGAKPDDDIIVAAATDADAIAAVAKWSAFSAEKTVLGLPGLASFDYTVAAPIIANSVKETIALAAKTEFTVNYELTVGFRNYNNVFACDAAGDFIQLYGKNDLKVGDVIPAGWKGTYELYSGTTPEITNFGELPAVTEGSFTAAVVAASEVTTDLVNAVVTINNVVLEAATPADKNNFTGKVGDVELTFRNNYTLASVEAGTYNITVVVNNYKGAVQLYVVAYEKSQTSGIELIDADDAEALYYNLQGVRVENPENGLYIRVRGNVIDKVVK